MKTSLCFLFFVIHSIGLALASPVEIDGHSYEIKRLKDQVIAFENKIVADVSPENFQGKFCQEVQDFLAPQLADYKKYHCEKMDEINRTFCENLIAIFQKALIGKNDLGDNEAKNPILFSISPQEAPDLAQAQEKIKTLFHDDVDVEVWPVSKLVSVILEKNGLELSPSFFLDLLDASGTSGNLVSSLELMPETMLFKSKNRAVSCALWQKKATLNLTLRGQIKTTVRPLKKQVENLWTSYKSSSDKIKTLNTADNVVYQGLELGLFLKSEQDKLKKQGLEIVKTRELFDLYFQIKTHDLGTQIVMREYQDAATLAAKILPNEEATLDASIDVQGEDL